MKKLLFIILFVFVSALFNSTLLSQKDGVAMLKDEDFIKQFNAETTTKMVITSDDGTSVALLQLNTDDNSPRSLAPVVIMNIEKTMVFFKFNYQNNYFKDFTDDYQLRLEKDKDFNYVSTYNLIFKYKDGGYSGEPLYVPLKMPLEPKKEYEEKHYYFWIDKDNKYSGSIAFSLGFSPVVLNEKEIDSLKEYYEHIEDLYLDFVQNEIDIYKEKLERDDFTFNINYSVYFVINFISLFNPENGTRLNGEMSEINKQIVMKRNASANNTLLVRFILPVSKLCEAYVYRITEKELENKPTFELPMNEEELKIYLDWLVSLENPKGGMILDAYGTEVKFELTDEGLKVMSAGTDKEFGTDDDTFYLRKYDTKID